MEPMSQICMKNKVKKTQEFYYLLAEIQVLTFILLELNIFHSKHQAKSEINLSLTTCLVYILIISLFLDIFYYFHRYKFTGKPLLDYTNFFFLLTVIKGKKKIRYKYLKDKYEKRKCRPWI